MKEISLRHMRIYGGSVTELGFYCSLSLLGDF